jgi:hypothetical protein
MTSKPKPKSRFQIEVTEADIEAAVPKDSGHCAISDAISRQIPGVTNVTTDLATIRWTDRAAGVRYTFLTPRVAQALLLDFDNGDREYCQPFTFRLDKPAHVTPIVANRGKVAQERKTASAARLAVIKEREKAGDTLTSDERRIVKAAAVRAARPAPPERPTSGGPRKIEIVGPDEHGDPAGAMTITGGQAMARGALAHGRGHIRQFGVKSAGSPKPLPKSGDA